MQPDYGSGYGDCTGYGISNGYDDDTKYGIGSGIGSGRGLRNENNYGFEDGVPCVYGRVAGFGSGFVPGSGSSDFFGFG